MARVCPLYKRIPSLVNPLFAIYVLSMSIWLPEYEPPKTNAEGLILLWTVIYPAELARQLSERGTKISRAAVGKWRSVPQHRVAEVSKITGIPREHLLPEVYAPV